VRPLTSRTFQLADALILIGGTAVSLALVRRNWELFFAGRIFETPPDGWSLKIVAHWALAVIGYLLAQAMAVAAVALLAIRLRGPCRDEAATSSSGSIVGSRTGRRTHLHGTPDEPREKCQIFS
jgi:hypothetical protein